MPTETPYVMPLPSSSSACDEVDSSSPTPWSHSVASPSSSSDSTGAVTYHYHARDHYNTPGTPHVPYYMGCQGPSKGRCNDTVSDEYDGGSNWCGQGCGFEVCVQPGTDKAKLQVYLASFPAGDKWLDGFSVNPF